MTDRVTGTDAYDAVLVAVLAELDEADAVTVALYDEADAALWAGLSEVLED